MKKEHYLITGGSGFLGINLIRHLLDQGHKITSIDLEKFDYPEKDKINDIVGDVRKREDMNKALKGVDKVVHCAAALPLYTEKKFLVLM